MKRRSFLRAAGAGAVAGAAALAAPAVARNKLRLKMVTTWPKNFPGLGTGAERIARRIAEASDGAIEIRVFAAGELVPAFSAFDAVAGGTAEIYHAADYYWQGKSQAFNFFAAIPFGMNSQELAAWIRFGGGQELWDELCGGFGIKPLVAGSTGTQMGGWFSREINSVEDFKGLKIRLPGLGGEVYRRLGAAVVTLAGGEIFTSLQSGAIDAADWVGPWNDLAFGFYKIVKYYYYPGFHEPGTILSLGFNKAIWDDLTKPHKTIIRAAAAAEHSLLLSEFQARNAGALKVLIDSHGVKLRRFSDEILARIKAVSAEVVRETRDSDAMTARVHDSYQAFARDAEGWTDISEMAYGQARQGPPGG